MKSVLISIQPKWCELIASGKKTVEVRKTQPKLEAPFKVYIYCTGGFAAAGTKAFANGWRGHVIGEFTCNEIECFTTDYRRNEEQTARISRLSCVDMVSLMEYEANSPCLYGWHISDLQIYDEPKPLGDFHTLKKCNSCRTTGYESSGCIYDEDCRVPAVITRPPQSWCYVEEA